MAKGDGITIPVEWDVKKPNLEQAKAAITKALTAHKDDPMFAAANKSAEALIKNIDKMIAQGDKLQGKMVLSEDYTAKVKELEEVRAKYSAIRAERDKFQAKIDRGTGTAQTERAIAERTAQLAELDAKAKSLNMTILNIDWGRSKSGIEKEVPAVNSLAGAIQTLDTDYQNLTNTYNNLSAKQAEQRKAIEAAQGQGYDETSKKVKVYQQELINLRETLKSLKESGYQRGDEEYDKVTAQIRLRVAYIKQYDKVGEESAKKELERDRFLAEEEAKKAEAARRAAEQDGYYAQKAKDTADELEGLGNKLRGFVEWYKDAQQNINKYGINTTDFVNFEKYIDEQSPKLSELVNRIRDLRHEVAILSGKGYDISGVMKETDLAAEMASASMKSLQDRVSISGLTTKEATAIYFDFQKKLLELMEIKDSNNYDIQDEENLISAIDKVNERYALLGERIYKTANAKKKAAAEASIDFSDYEVANEDIVSMVKELGILQSRVKDLKAHGISLGFEDYDNAITRIEEIKVALKEYEKELKAAGQASLDSEEDLEEFEEELEDSGDGFYRFNTYSKRGVSGLTLFGNACKKLVNTIKTGIKNGLKTIADRFKQIERNSDGVTKSMRRGLKGIMKYVLGFRSLFFLVRQLKKAIKEGLENLVQFESATNETNKVISELRDEILFLKNAWAAAVAPVLNVVVPILNILIDKFAELGNSIASFMARLAGQETVIHAIKVEMGDYAESLKKSAGNSKKAADAAKKLHDRLAPFDDLQVLGKDDDPTSKTPTGGGGGGSPEDSLDPNKMFKRVITESSLADMIIKGWENQDMSPVGNFIGQKIRDAFSNISWDDIKADLSEKIHAVTTFINGLFETPELFSTIGTNLAEGLNTAIGGVKQFLDELDWYTIFHSIGDGIENFFTTLDYNQMLEGLGSLGQAIMDSISGLFDGLLDEDGNFTIFDNLFAALEAGNLEKKFYEWGSNISSWFVSMFSKLDWKKAQQHLRIAITSVTQFLNGLLSDPEFFATIFSAGANLINTLILGIQNFLDGMDWAEIAESFANGINQFFEDLDEEEFFKTMNKLVIAINSILVTLIEKVKWGEILAAITDGFEGACADEEFIKAIASSLEVLIKGAIALIKLLPSYFEGLSDKFKERMRNAGVQGIEGLKKGILKGLEVIGTWIKENVIDPIIDFVCGKDGFDINSPSKVFEGIGENLINGLLQGINNLIDTVAKPFEDLKTKLTEIWDKIRTSAKNKWTTIKENIVYWAELIWSNIKKPFESIKNFISDLWDDVKETTSSVWNSIWDTIKGVINWILGGIEKFVNATIDGINAIIGVFDVRNSLPDSVKSVLGITSEPTKLTHITIPKLAQGAVIPPNKQFLAMLGDQTSGTNVEAPLDTIKQALSEVMGNLQVENKGPMTMELDGQTFARLFVPYVVSELGRQGYTVNVEV